MKKWLAEVDNPTLVHRRRVGDARCPVAAERLRPDAGAPVAGGGPAAGRAGPPDGPALIERATFMTPEELAAVSWRGPGDAPARAGAGGGLGDLGRAT